MGCLLKANGLYSRTTIGAVLLADDAGARFGGRPTALLELGGVPLVMRTLVALSGAGIDELVLVVGPHADAVEAAVGSFPITIVRRGDGDRVADEPLAGDAAWFADGAAARSIRLGLQALSPRLDAVIIARADQPMVDAQDIVALIGAFKKRGEASLVVPRVQRPGQAPQPGNPLIFDAAWRDEWLDASAGAAGGRGRSLDPSQRRWFDTDNRRYGVEVGTPEDLARFAAETGHALRWPAAFAEAPREPLTGFST